MANRVEEISAVGGVWSWVPTDENPADLPTRGTTASQLSASKLWWNGPHWLTGSESVWPKHQKNVETEKQVQRKFFWEELKALGSGQAVHRQSSVVSLHPFLEDGLIRMGGRFQQVEAAFDEVHPVLVKRCGIIDQLVHYVHEQMQRGGPAVVISEMRLQGVWILRSKRAVSYAIRKCRKCSGFLAGLASEQIPPLPDVV